MELGECAMPGCDAPASLSYEFSMTAWDRDGGQVVVFQKWSCARSHFWDQEKV